MSPAPANSSRMVQFGAYRFDIEHSTLYHGDEPVILPRKRMEVLRLLAGNAGRIVRKEEILEQVWPDQFIDENNLTLQVFKLRRDLEADPRKPVHILTVPGIGYMLRIDPPPVAGQPTEWPADSLGADSLGAGSTVPGSSVAAAAAVPDVSGPRSWLRGRQPPVIIAVLCILAGLLLGAIGWHRHPDPPAVVQAYTSLPGLESDPAFSPAGSQLVFSSEGETNNNRDLYLKRSENEEPIRLTDHPDIDSQPAWSPDGRQIAFLRQRESNEDRTRLILLTSLDGAGSAAAEKEIAIVGSGLDWAPDGSNFVIADPPGVEGGTGLSLLSVDGRERRSLTRPTAGKVTSDIQPRFSPDGRRIAFLRVIDGETALTDLFLVEPGQESVRQLTFDQRRIADLQWMPDGRSILIASDRDGQRRLWQIPLDGGPPVIVTTISGMIQDFDLSHDGQLLAFTERIQDTTIEIRRLGADHRATGEPPCLINSSAIDDSPRFAPDGTRLAFISGRSGRNELWTARADCTGLAMIPTFTDSGSSGSPRWSPDGEWIAFDRRHGQLINSFLIELANSQNGPRPLRITENSNLTPAWSADGKRIYFESSRRGQPQIWQEDLASGEQSKVTIGRGRDPVETADGSILFHTRDNHLWQLDQRTGIEEPVRELADLPVGRNWSVSSQGIYFIPRSNEIRPGIHRLDLRTRQVTRLMELGGFPVRAVPGLSVTADEKLLAVSYISYRLGDIRLARGWRGER